MKQSEQVFLYPGYRPLEIKTGRYNVYLQGKPTLISSPEGTDNWITEITKHIDSSNLNPEVPLATELRNTSGLFSLILRTENEFISRVILFAAIRFFMVSIKTGCLLPTILKNSRKKMGGWK